MIIKNEQRAATDLKWSATYTQYPSRKRFYVLPSKTIN